MDEEIIEVTGTSHNKKGKACIITGFTLCIGIAGAFFYTLNEVKEVNTTLFVIKDTSERTFINLEALKGQKRLLEETLKAFQNAPKTTSEEIIRKANKFEVIKRIHLTRQVLKTTSDIRSELEKIAEYPDISVKEKIQHFIRQELLYIKSNTELNSIVEQIKVEPLAKQPAQGYLITIKHYFSKLVQVKTTEEYQQEKLVKEKLVGIRKAIEQNNIALAGHMIKTLPIRIKELENLWELLSIRIKLEKLLNEITLSMMQND